MHANTYNLVDTTMLHSFVWIFSMCVMWIIIDVTASGIGVANTAAVSFAAVAAAASATADDDHDHEFSSFQPAASANFTHFPVYDFVEIDETNHNYAIRTTFPKYSNAQNQQNHHKHHHYHHNYHHKHDHRMNQQTNMHHLNAAENYRHQHKLKHGDSNGSDGGNGGDNGNGDDDDDDENGSETVEWIRHATEMDNEEIRPPKARRRHEKRWHRNHRQFIGNIDHITSKLHSDLEIQSARMIDAMANDTTPIHWPVKKEAIMEGDVILGGLMMVHSREDSMMCGPIMPQGGIQALEAMLFTLDKINADSVLLPNITIGAHILDDCDRDSYGLEMAVDFIKGMYTSS